MSLSELRIKVLFIRCRERYHILWLWDGHKSLHCCACAKFRPPSEENAEILLFDTSAQNDNFLPKAKCSSVVIHAASYTAATSLFVWANLDKFALLCSSKGACTTSVRKILCMNRSVRRSSSRWYCVSVRWRVWGGQQWQQQRAWPEVGSGCRPAGLECSRKSEALLHSAPHTLHLLCRSPPQKYSSTSTPKQEGAACYEASS